VAFEGGRVSWDKPQTGVLPGGRLHLQHGPIDLVIRAEGEPALVASSYVAASERFQTVLGELAAELAMLRQPLQGVTPPDASSPIARRMIAACWPYRNAFITPMAAVAGSVADEIYAVMLAIAPDLRTLFVNNGGDVAVHVADGQVLRIGVVADLEAAIPEGVIRVHYGSGIGGIATSGWRGRSFSLGIADAVSILAHSAAAADAAATIIANFVDVDDPAVSRASAISLDPDSDLGGLLVTTDVRPLANHQIDAALAAGSAQAQRFLDEGMILAAAMVLQGQWRIVQGQSGLLFPMA
jgi:uncharacterized protein